MASSEELIDGMIIGGLVVLVIAAYIPGPFVGLGLLRSQSSGCGTSCGTLSIDRVRIG